MPSLVAGTQSGAVSELQQLVTVWAGYLEAAFADHLGRTYNPDVLSVQAKIDSTEPAFFITLQSGAAGRIPKAEQQARTFLGEADAMYGPIVVEVVKN